jgi:tripartite-type tricarboxylate transporter receptor subunit TctC
VRARGAGRHPRSHGRGWNELANAALHDAKLRDQVSALDYEVRGGTAKEFAEFMMHDISRYKRLAEDMALAED